MPIKWVSHIQLRFIGSRTNNFRIIHKFRTELEKAFSKWVNIMIVWIDRGLILQKTSIAWTAITLLLIWLHLLPKESIRKCSRTLNKASTWKVFAKNIAKVSIKSFQIPKEVIEGRHQIMKREDNLPQRERKEERRKKSRCRHQLLEIRILEISHQRLTKMKRLNQKPTLLFLMMRMRKMKIILNRLRTWEMLHSLKKCWNTSIKRESKLATVNTSVMFRPKRLDTIQWKLTKSLKLKNLTYLVLFRNKKKERSIMLGQKANLMILWLKIQDLILSRISSGLRKLILWQLKPKRNS